MKDAHLGLAGRCGRVVTACQIMRHYSHSSVKLKPKQVCAIVLPTGAYGQRAAIGQAKRFYTTLIF